MSFPHLGLMFRETDIKALLQTNFALQWLFTATVICSTLTAFRLLMKYRLSAVDCPLPRECVCPVRCPQLH